MILVTGGTGFIGRALVRHLAEAGYDVRLLIRPSKESPELPRGVPVEVAVSSLTDQRGLRSAMVGVDTVYHLAGAEWLGPRASLMETDIQGTQSLCQAAAAQKVERILFVSHLGAERASAFPAFKSKGIAEEYIRRSGRVSWARASLGTLLQIKPFISLKDGERCGRRSFLPRRWASPMRKRGFWRC